MKTYISPAQRPDTETVVAVGSFDGVHLGHQALLARLKERSRHYRVPSIRICPVPAQLSVLVVRPLRLR